MKNKVTPTQQERILQEDDFIVSKTDTQGRITYCNEIFTEISGYNEAELVGSQHNIVRHPDMPRGVYKLMWDTIQQGQEFFGYVKNMSKDGGYYWVFANVTPDRDEQGKITGYFSVRRRPRPEAVKIVAEAYKTMLKLEQEAGPRDAIAASLAWLNDTLAQRKVTYEEFVLSL